MMETIRVNMTPCEDIKTIHASQNDNEAREWGFELHNNGDKIDSSSISDQLVFKAYEGGTEQILPTNGSTPTTSPFIGDIKYPQGLLTDQEFTYRQSPTEEDGLAFIESIKGNTLVWNQLVENGNFESTDGWRFPNGTASVSNNVLTVTATGSSLQIMRSSDSYTFIQGHKIYISCWIKSSVTTNDVRIRIAQNNPLAHIQSISKNLNANVRTNINGIITAESDTINSRFSIFIQNSANGEVYTVDSFVAFDLTQMGLDSITDPSDFISLFPLPYYAYNQGTLLSFMGNGIKTVSKNQFDTQVVTTSYAGLTLTKTNGTIRAVYSGGSQYAGFNFYGSPVFTDTFLKGRYRLSFDVSGLDTQWTVGLRQGVSFLGGGQALAISNDGHYSFTIDAEANPNCYLSFARTGNKTTAFDVTFSNIQLELGITESEYQPYETNTTELPISTYFPTGMKSAGSVYDELTETKATTRIGAIDLGKLDWVGGSWNGHYRYNAPVSNIKTPQDDYTDGLLCSKLQVSSYPIRGGSQKNNVIAKYSGRVYVATSDYTTANDFKTAMSGVYLYYELSTPTETSFTTASLVTENAEIPLSNEDGILVGKCTEQLSAEPGFHDAKIKLSDGDGTCYSNKLQLHVERSPQ